MGKNSTPEDLISKLKALSDENDSFTCHATEPFLFALFLQLKNMEFPVADRVVSEVFRLTGL